ncbi:MAG: hypothetical protein HZA28_03780 [Candidatus Omnitrophica bacterium]|nr:hypothetical protein [Candidatus Omnitrophota bacterium]
MSGDNILGLLAILAKYHNIVVFLCVIFFGVFLWKQSQIRTAEREELMTVIAQKLDRVDACSPVHYFVVQSVSNGKIEGRYRNRDVLCFMSCRPEVLTFKMKFDQKNKDPKFMIDYPRPTRSTYAKNGYVIYKFLPSEVRHKHIVSGMWSERVSSILEELYEGCQKRESVA